MKHKLHLCPFVLLALVFTLCAFVLPLVAIAADSVAAPLGVTVSAEQGGAITAQNFVTWLTPAPVPLLLAASGVERISPATGGQVVASNVNVGTAAYFLRDGNTLPTGYDVESIVITNNSASNLVDFKAQLSDGTNHTDLISDQAVSAGQSVRVPVYISGLDARRRLRGTATSGATDISVTFNIIKRS